MINFQDEKNKLTLQILLANKKSCKSQKNGIYSFSKKIKCFLKPKPDSFDFLLNHQFKILLHIYYY